MAHPFFEFFNRDRPFINPDTAKWPPEWGIVQWKSYPRYTRLPLPTPRGYAISLNDALLRRNSDRDFSGKPLTSWEISNLLFYSCGLTKPNSNLNRSRRPYPSGGALYPIEIYLLVFNGSEEIGAGIYHYNVLGHYLEKLPEENIEPLKAAFHDMWVTKAAMVLLFSFIEKRTKPKYGNFAYKVGLIEAGHIGQNVYLNSTALGLKCCAIGGFKEEALHQALDLDGNDEVLFYAVAVGK